jgi:hypothetical protein
MANKTEKFESKELDMDMLSNIWREYGRHIFEWDDHKKCDECEKQRKVEKDKRELEADLIHDVTKKLELLRVQPGDILMIRVDGRKPGVPEMLNAFRKVFEQAKKKDVWIIAIPSDMVLEQVKTKDMNPAGWYRKSQLIDPKIWEDDKKKSKARRIIVMDE